MNNKKIKVIGLCGRSGSGKGYICDIFNEFGIPSIDTDKVYRDIISEKDSRCLKELKNHFGEKVIDPDGSLNRKVLASIVFSDPDKLHILNSVTHKYILKKTDKLIKEYCEEEKDFVIVDAPVLFESGFNKICDICVCVTCGDEVSVKRICERDGVDGDTAEMRLRSQISEDKLRELCDHEIVNDDITDPKAEVETFINNVLKTGT